MKFLILVYLGCMLTDAFSQFTTSIIPEKLDSIIFPRGKEVDKPGMATAIFKNDSIVYFSTAGLANIQKDLPITLQTQFNIGSVTKMFTATAILLLEESGQLNRNDDISKYLPDAPHTQTVITINHLLSHTAGIRTHFELAQFLFNYKSKLAYFPEMMEYINKYNELNFSVGENFAYSNTGYMLLAMIIEKVSGMSYAEYVTKNIFEPLGMQNTYVTHSKLKYLADGTTSYDIKKNGKPKRAQGYIDALGATGINSTLYDMFLWDNNFNHNILGKGNSALITSLTSSFKLNSGESVHYGCGIIIKNYRGKTVQEHSGGWSNYLFQYRRFPDEHISILSWNNGSNYSPFITVDKVSDAILNFNEAKANIDVRPAFDQNKLCGTYITENNFIREVKVLNDTLVLQLPLNQSQRYHPLIFTGPVNDSIIYYIDTAGNSVQFFKSGDSITGFSWSGGEYFVAERCYTKINDSFTFEPKTLVGKYYLENQNNKIKITYKQRKQSLYLSPFPFYHFKMEHVTGNVFHLAYYDYYIQVNEDGIVLGDDWIFNLRFLKQ